MRVATQTLPESFDDLLIAAVVAPPQGLHSKTSSLGSYTTSRDAAALRACGHCGQHFVSVFTELIDWSGGEDDQQWSVLPVTRSESHDLAAVDARVIEEALNRLAPRRQALCRRFPRGAQPTEVYWCSGISVGMHD